MSRIILTAVALFGFGAGPQAMLAKTLTKAACTTVDSADIGKLPLTLTVGSVEVEFTGWKTRDELNTTESVGFSINASGPMTWVTESGTERGFTGSGPDFLDELALVKPTAPTLSRITFCAG